MIQTEQSAQVWTLRQLLTRGSIKKFADLHEEIRSKQPSRKVRNKLGTAGIAIGESGDVRQPVTAFTLSTGGRELGG